MVTVTVEYLDEDYEVEIICPPWAIHKKEGGDPPDPDRFEEEGGESMWELYVHENGQKAAKKAFEKKRTAMQAAEKAANDKRLASLKKSFEAFDEDGSGTLEAEEVVEILTRMTGGGNELTLDDAKAFIKEFDRDGDGMLDVNEFIVAMGVVSDAVDADGDGEADRTYDGKEEAFAAKLAAGEELEDIKVKGIESGNVVAAVEDARRLQK